MTRGARLLVGLAVLLGGGSDLAAQTGGAGAGPHSPLSGLEFAVSGGLAVTAVAVIAALVAFRRLRRTEALLREIFSAVPQPRQVVDSAGRTVFANRSFYDVFGGAGKPIPELLAAEVAGDEEARDQLERLAANARNGVPGYVELRVSARRKAGDDGPGGAGSDQAEWRNVAAYPLSGGQGRVLWMVDDITMRRQLEQVIHQEQERFVDLLEHAPIGFYSVDGEGRFLFANQTLCDWLGMSHEDLENGTVHLHDVVAEALPAATPPYAPFAGRDAAPREISLKSADGGRFQASISQDVVAGEDGRVLRTRSVVRHLSDERAMAEALEHSVQRFARFFSEAPVGIALLDSSGKVAECNGSFGALI
ncbi:MAG: PAS domain S-box protein, partial [Gammaproteobacteria bacterium]|nr:PAS domain S-box protein [Gammaproteobacteria bacterium]